jgi:hypothetical protein
MTKNEKLTEENASLLKQNAAIRAHLVGVYEALEAEKKRRAAFAVVIEDLDGDLDEARTFNETLSKSNADLIDAKFKLELQVGQLQSNLAVFRDRFIARQFENRMESRMWDIDIVKLLGAVGA